MSTSTSRRRFYLLTLPRTASNLLVKILALEEQCTFLIHERGGYFFMPTTSLRLHDPKTAGRHLNNWTLSERTKIRDSYQLLFDNLQRHVQTAEEQGKHIFVKEHLNWMIEPVAETKFIYGEENTDEVPWTVNTDADQTHSALNKTIIPDEFLKTWFPTFLIRHPALVFPSNYRTYVDNEGKEAVKNEANLQALEMTYHWTRTLYAWYTQHFQTSGPKSAKDITWPIILEADDVMLEPELVLRYARIIGLDPIKLKFSWAPKSKEQLDKLWDVEMRMLSTISTSAGILEGKTASWIVIGEEVAKWKVEFGKHEGAKIEGWVRGAMMDYEYLKARRFTT